MGPALADVDWCWRVLVISIYLAMRGRTHTPDSRAAELSSIAVLPFADLSPEQDQEYFCDGMTEEIIDALSKIGGIRVVARTSSFAFKGKQQDIREIGKKLNVAAVLEGSVRKDGNRLRVTAQLNSVADGYHLWSETYERELKDVFTVQDEISRAIVNTLQLKLSSRGDTAEFIAGKCRDVRSLPAGPLSLEPLENRRRRTSDSLFRSRHPERSEIRAGLRGSRIFLLLAGFLWRPAAE